MGKAQQHIFYNNDSLLATRICTMDTPPPIFRDDFDVVPEGQAIIQDGRRHMRHSDVKHNNGE